MNLTKIWVEHGKKSRKFRKAFMRQKPTNLRIYNNNICNFSCVHCYYGFQTGEEKDPLLTDEQWRKVIDKSIDYGINFFQFIGKEPFATSNIWTLIDYLKEYRDKGHDIEWGVTTNGSLLVRPDIREKLPDSGFTNAYLSVDSFDVLGIRVTRVGNRISQALEILNEANVPIVVSIDCYKGNYNKVKKIMETAYGTYGVREFNVHEVTPTPGSFNTDIFLDAEEVYEVMKQVTAFSAEHDDAKIVLSIDGKNFDKLLEQERPLAKEVWSHLMAFGTSDLLFGNISVMIAYFVPSYLYDITVTADGYMMGIGLEAARKDYWNLSPGKFLEEPLDVLVKRGKERTLAFNTSDHDTTDSLVCMKEYILK